MKELYGLIKKIESIDKDELKKSIKDFAFELEDQKFNVAFSCYGIAKRLNNIDPIHLIDEETQFIKLEDVEIIKAEASLILKLYTCFVYMRSDILERRLDGVSDKSCLFYYQKLFRKGKNGEMTIPQHIRNSLSHGTFEMNKGKIKFKDCCWEIELR